MSIKQISVFLENKPGTLKKMTGVLAAKKVDMRALSLAETKDFGIARIIVDDVFEAVQLLSIFSEAEVNIEYMYAFLGGSDVKSAYMIFRVADTKGAEARLTKKGLRVLTQEDITNI